MRSNKQMKESFENLPAKNFGKKIRVLLSIIDNLEKEVEELKELKTATLEETDNGNKEEDNEEGTNPISYGTPYSGDHYEGGDGETSTTFGEEDTED